jgi:hypothetical protein
MRSEYAGEQLSYTLARQLAHCLGGDAAHIKFEGIGGPQTIVAP